MGGITTAEKRTQIEEAGELWPLYPDGTKQIWSKAGVRNVAGGSWISWDNVQARRNRGRAALLKDGRCGTKGCENPKFRLSKGTYHSQCREHISEHGRDRYYGRKAEGLCTQCGKDLAITETMCFTCAGKQDEYRMTRSY